jgi:hypothetical protein
LLEIFLIDYFDVFFIQTDIKGLINTQAGVFPHFFLLIGKKISGPIKFLLILFLFRVGEHGRGLQSDEIPDLIDLFA